MAAHQMLCVDLGQVLASHLLPGLRVTPAGLRLVLEVTSASTRRRGLSIKRELYGEWKVLYIVVDRNNGPYTVTAYGPPLPEWVALDALRIG